MPLFDANGDAVINWDGTGTVHDSAGQVLWDPAGGTTYSYNGVTLTSANVVDVLGHSFPTSTTLMGLREQTGVHNNLNAGEPTQTWGVSGRPSSGWFRRISGTTSRPSTTRRTPT